ncbi:MAG: class I SAM-dependent methyltransferase [Promethearchaeota archaeon]
MVNIEPFKKHVDRYEGWFDKNKVVYDLEVEAIRRFLNAGLSGLDTLEIGVGSGRFASPLGVMVGVEPSLEMLGLALNRGILGINGIGEVLPLRSGIFTSVLMVTTICFLDDVIKAFREVYRVLMEGGSFVIGFVDKDSPIGQEYYLHKNESLFYKAAHFYTTDDVLGYLRRVGFQDFSFVQTLFHSLLDVRKDDGIETGHGRGSFVVIKATRGA